LISYSSGNLKTFLENLDLGNTDIKTIDDLLNYLISMAETNQFSLDELNEALLQMFTSGKTEKTAGEISSVKKGGFASNVLASGAIILGLGLIIFIFILRERKRRKENQGS
jgi:uncharacterized membrane protein